MPRREGAHVPIEALPPEERARIESGAQTWWYGHVAHWIGGRSVLDVGSGDGAALPRLAAAGAAQVLGIDIAPASPSVQRTHIEDVAVKSWDVVLAMDVIEHVEDDVGFLGHLLRVARKNVFFSTPNYNWPWARLRNPHHVREYTAEELAALLCRFGCKYEAWALSFERVFHHLDVLEGKHEWDASGFGIWIRCDGG